MSALRYSVWLSLLTAPGSLDACRLVEAFSDDCEALYSASEEDYLAAGIRKEYASRLADKRLDNALGVIDFCEKNHIDLIPYDHPRYPKRLRRLPDFPLLLYCRGRLPDIDNEVVIAAVGTRSMTEYGKENGYVISRDLARAGAVVVSGLASGVDSACHRGALDALGLTVAVLGCGIDVVYPKHNRDLMEEIAQNGALLTEYPPGAEPASYHFPKRNRIISGLALGTLVIEADRNSGAMITVRHAQKQGRDIFALPGRVGEMNSAGTNGLIKEGARVVTSALDILDVYEAVFPQKIHPERVLLKRTSMRVENPRTLRVASPVVPIRNGATAEKESPSLTSAHRAPRHVMGGTEAESASNGGCLKQENPPSGKQKKSGGDAVRKKNHPEENKRGAGETETEHRPFPAGLSDTDRKILEVMPEGRAVSADEIVRSGIPVNEVLASLTSLEIRRLIVRLPNGKHMKNI